MSPDSDVVIPWTALASSQSKININIQNDDNLLTSNRNVLDSRTFQNRFAVSYFTLKLGEKENKSTIVPNLGVMKTTPY